MSPRILVGAILHETNTFNTLPTRLADFAGRYLCLDAASIQATLTGTATEMGGFMSAAERHGWRTELSVAAACGPSGPLVAEDWARLRARLTDKAGPFDGILLALHGAMVTFDSTDPEGDLLNELRASHGPAVPIVVTLDMHANVSPRMVAAADAFCTYETYPHIDHADCAERAAEVLASLIARQRPVGGPERMTRTAVARPPMLDAADHGRTDPPGPMNALIERARGMRRIDGVVATGLTIGFPWADVPDCGPAALVTVAHDSAVDPAALAKELAEGLWESRTSTQLDFASPQEAMARARRGRPGDRPLVLADIADNPAGGAYGDSPNLLRAMIAANLENAAFAALVDPAAVGAAFAAGVGAELTLALGGRHAPHISPPLQADATVLRLHSSEIKCAGPVLRGVSLDMGPMALVKVGDIRVVLSSRALAVTDLNLFRALGIEPGNMTTIALKSRNHHRAAFGPLSREVLLVDAGGISTMRLAELPYDNLPRPIWPLDPDPDPELTRILEFPRYDDHAPPE